MASLGIRCFGDNYCYVLLSGTRSSPIILAKDKCTAPPNDPRPSQLAWLRSEIHEILNRYDVKAGFVRTIENVAKNKDPRRSQFEGVVLEAIASHPSRPTVDTLILQQIKARTGFPSFARYCTEMLKQPGLSEVNRPGYSEAALAALCGLPA